MKGKTVIVLAVLVILSRGVKAQQVQFFQSQSQSQSQSGSVSQQQQQQVIYITATPIRPPTNTPMPSVTPGRRGGVQGAQSTQSINGGKQVVINSPTSTPAATLTGQAQNQQQKQGGFFNWLFGVFNRK